MSEDLEPPWVFRYMDDPAETTARDLNEEPSLRPVVPVRLLNGDEISTRAVALVDSGSERTYAAPGYAREIGIDLRNSIETMVGLGGSRRLVRFAYARVQLMQDLLGDTVVLAEWETRIGFLANWEPPWSVLLGQRGFFDQFTITMHRAVPALVVEKYEAFDERYGVQVETVDLRQPRFRQ